MGKKEAVSFRMAIWFTLPFILLLAPDWNWIIFVNVLLGITQGLAWS